MKKTFFLIGVIAWSMIALVALAILIISLSGAGLSEYMPAWFRYGSFSGTLNANTPSVKEETIPLGGDITELVVETHYQSINITLISGGSGGEMAIRHYDIESAEPFTWETSGSKLSVSVPNRNFVSLNMMSPRLEIDLPQSYTGSVKLESSSGGVEYGRICCVGLSLAD